MCESITYIVDDFVYDVFILTHKWKLKIAGSYKL